MRSSKIMPNDAPDQPKSLVVLLNDLIFSTKISASARALGLRLTVVRSTRAMVDAIDCHRPALVVIDLNSAGEEAAGAVRAAATHAVKPHVLAFVSHVDQTLAEQATAAGANQVLPRSAFSRDLDAILRTHCVAGA